MKIKGIKLNVMYEEKNQAKILGAKWDVQHKTWYLPITEELKPFTCWMDSNFLLYDNDGQQTSILDNMYQRFFMEIREGFLCYKCNKKMDILQPFSKQPKDPSHTKPHEYSLIWDKGNSYVTFANELGIKMKYISTSVVKHPYAVHICPHCNQIQGDFYIFEDKDCLLPVKKAFMLFMIK